MKKHFPLKILLIIGIILITVSIFIVPVQRCICFYYQNTDKLVAYLPVDVGDTFQIIFTHSIHLTDVVEKYKVTEDNQIEQYEIIFEEFGIGMPSNAEDGQVFVYEDGRYHIKNLGNVFSSMNIRNGKVVSNHRLVWGENEEHKVFFNDYFVPGEWYEVKIDHLTLWQSMRGVKIHE